MPESEIKALRRIYDALSRWDMEEFINDVTHDFELILPDTVPWGGTRHGRDGMEAFATIFRDHVEGQWADPDDFIVAGELIVVLGRLRGRARASGRGIRGAFCPRLDHVRRDALAVSQLFRHCAGHARAPLAGE